jgi:hypothetical protein
MMSAQEGSLRCSQGRQAPLGAVSSGGVPGVPTPHGSLGGTTRRGLPGMVSAKGGLLGIVERRLTCGWCQVIFCQVKSDQGLL